jgi:PAS domain-containing protein
VRDRQQRQHRATSEEHNGKAVPLERPGLLAAIVEGTTDAVFVKDLDGRYLMVNSSCARILGRPKETIIGKVGAQLLPSEPAGRLLRERLHVLPRVLLLHGDDEVRLEAQDPGDVYLLRTAGLRYSADRPRRLRAVAGAADDPAPDAEDEECVGQAQDKANDAPGATP